MKKVFIFLILFLIAGSLTALGYSLYRSGIIESPARTASSTSEEATSTSQASDKNDLSWMQQIKGISEDTTSMKATTSTNANERATSTMEGDDTEPATSTTSTTSDDSATINEEQTSSSDTIENTQTIQDLGKTDALTSTSYDYAFKALVLSAELRHGTVFLTWTAATNDSFLSYKIVRSTTDENPYFPKTTAIKSTNDVTQTAYTDASVQDGKTYYYRICMTKQKKPPACGNVLEVSF